MVLIISPASPLSAEASVSSRPAKERYSSSALRYPSSITRCRSPASLPFAFTASPRIRNFSPSDDEPAPDTGSLPAAIESLERRMITAAMRRHNGNKTRAAEDLKVSRRNLIRLVQKYQLEK